MPLSPLAIVCPLCRLPLDRQIKLWRCAGGHSFDVARDGYVNLLPVQQKNSLDPGDSAESLAARRDFLQAGHYRPLRDAVLRMLAPLQAQRLLDLGCGEGYYTSAFPTVAAEVIGLDIAKPAIQLAARRFKNSTWLVASGAQLPVADGALDAITCLFTQLHVIEMQRALRSGGHVLVVTPAPTHLWSLRAGLFDEVRAHEPDKFLAGFAEAEFEAVAREEVRARLSLTQATLKQLLAMTPYVWKARPEKRTALEQSETFETEAAFSLLLFKKR
jgi:23S rRNA (guanine745-N1)-methyltransferase